MVNTMDGWSECDQALIMQHMVMRCTSLWLTFPFLIHYAPAAAKHTQMSERGR